MHRVYLDLCVLKRPFDDQSQPRIWLETQAVSLIIQAIQDGQVELAGSSLLDFENSQNPWPLRRDAVARWLDLAKLVQRLTAEVEQRGAELRGLGLGAIDALHLACAEAVGADVFVTCDDQVRRRYSGKLCTLLPADCATVFQEASDGDQSTQ